MLFTCTRARSRRRRAPAGTVRMFSSYESEFTRACIDANAHVSALEQLLPGIERDAAKRQAEKAVDAAAEVVSQLEMEAGPADRARVRECRATLGQLRAKFAAARSTTRVAELQREELMRRADEPQRIEAEQQHTRLLETTSRMQRGTDKLRQACQVAIETETVGASILTDLDQQRMTLEQTRERLRNANRGLAKSKKLLQSMTKRAWANKVLMVGIIFFLVLMIAAIIYLKWIWSPHSAPAPVASPPPPPPSPPPPVQRRHLLWEHRGPAWLDD